MNALQAAWSAAQGLGRTEAMPPAEVARRFGWLRSVGSANPYLAIHARTGASRAEIERTVADAELVELPAARGCTYYVPREDAALALRLGEMTGGTAEFRMAERHLGVTKAEVANLADAIVRALEEEPLEPRALAARVAPRHLGDEGKRRGMTSTLSLGLARLQGEGRVRRLPQGGRLDTERYRYALWSEGPKPGEMDEATVAREMSRRYFRWAGPATEREFRDFTGLSAKLAKGAMEGLIPWPDDPTRWTLEREKGEPSDRVVLLASLDPWLHLRRSLPTLLEPSDAARRLPSGKGLADATGLRELDSHPIVRGGIVVGLWEYDPEAQAVAAWAWREDDATREAVAATGAWIADELGDFRSFTLDSPASRRPRIELLRSLSV